MRAIKGAFVVFRNINANASRNKERWNSRKRKLMLPLRTNMYNEWHNKVRIPE